MGAHGIPEAIHADRGTSMTSKPVAQLMVDLGVARSHSRPHVSNDNPYSEAAFKTLKYAPVFPDRFGSLADARAFSERILQLQPRAPPLRDRTPHPGVDALRHRDRGPRPAAADPERRLRRPPRTLREPPTSAAEAAHRRLDQPAHEGGPHTDRVTRRVSTGLTPSDGHWRVAVSSSSTRLPVRPPHDLCSPLPAATGGRRR